MITCLIITVSACLMGCAAVFLSLSDMRKAAVWKRETLQLLWLANESARLAGERLENAKRERQLAQLIKSHHGTEEVKEG